MGSTSFLRIYFTAGFNFLQKLQYFLLSTVILVSNCHSREGGNSCPSAVDSRLRGNDEIWIHE
jgi:hypothetical protein